MKLNVDANKKESEGAEEKAEESDEEGEATYDPLQEHLKTIEDQEEKEITKALVDLIRERQQSEQVDDESFGETIMDHVDQYCLKNEEI